MTNQTNGSTTRMKVQYADWHFNDPMAMTFGTKTAKNTKIHITRTNNV